MDPIMLERSGNTPIRVRGELVAEASGAAEKAIRWHTIRVVRVEGGGWAAGVEFCTTWKQEPGHAEAIRTDKVQEVIDFLVGYDLEAHIRGFPPGEKYQARQDRLLAELRAAYDEQVRKVLRAEMFAETEGATK